MQLRKPSLCTPNRVSSTLPFLIATMKRSLTSLTLPFAALAARPPLTGAKTSPSYWETKLRPPLTCAGVSPAISGVPVPGAYAGSSPSISKLMYTGLSPICFRTSAISGTRDLLQHSSAGTTRKPCGRTDTGKGRQSGASPAPPGISAGINPHARAKLQSCTSKHPPLTPAFLFSAQLNGCPAGQAAWHGTRCQKAISFPAEAKGIFMTGEY